MPSAFHALTMARYNLWQNRNLLDATSTLTSAERARDRGAFFGSIEKTFFHLFWADRIWMSRFTGSTPPAGGIAQSLTFEGSWEEFLERRSEWDRIILDWARGLEDGWFEGDITWFSGATGREMKRPKTILVMQLFNHQTHHRGQIHAMLTSAGARPSDTDIPFMPEEFARM